MAFYPIISVYTIPHPFGLVKSFLDFFEKILKKDLLFPVRHGMIGRYRNMTMNKEV